MDQVDVAKVVQSKIGGVLVRLMDDLVPEVRPLIARSPDLEAVSEEERSGAATIVAGKVVATMVIASVLAQLRGHGCPDEVLEQVVLEAQAYERANALAVSS